MTRQFILYCISGHSSKKALKSGESLWLMGLDAGGNENVLFLKKWGKMHHE
jgi:hypothetical protein